MRSRPLRTPESSRVLRFLASGVFNTALTYCLYLLALRFLTPALAYTAVYVLGIALAYVLNRHFVFRAHAGWRSVVAMPVIYLCQYGLSLAIVTLWVRAGLPASLAPLPAIAVCTPLVYLFSRSSFMKSAAATADQ